MRIHADLRIRKTALIANKKEAFSLTVFSQSINLLLYQLSIKHNFIHIKFSKLKPSIEYSSMN
jgi:hypothetical protein